MFRKRSTEPSSSRLHGRFNDSPRLPLRNALLPFPSNFLNFFLRWTNFFFSETIDVEQHVFPCDTTQSEVALCFRFTCFELFETLFGFLFIFPTNTDRRSNLYVRVIANDPIVFSNSYRCKRYGFLGFVWFYWCIRLHQICERYGGRFTSRKLHVCIWFTWTNCNGSNARKGLMICKIASVGRAAVCNLMSILFKSCPDQCREENSCCGVVPGTTDNVAHPRTSRMMLNVSHLIRHEYTVRIYRLLTLWNFNIFPVPGTVLTVRVQAQ